MKMIKNLLILGCMTFMTAVSGQEVINASIYDIILTAQSESPDYLLAKTRENNAYWRYVSSKSVFKPQLGFNATIPSVTRSISAITLPDGTQTFVSRSFMSNSVGLSLGQVLSSTGGSVYVASSLERLDQFKTDALPGSSSYLSSPISIGFNQPLFQFNPYKWDKKEVEITYSISKKYYVEEKEAVAFQAMNNFFDLYTSNLSLEEARRNQVYLDSIAVNAKGRFEVGRISETDLLQIQLSAKNASGTVSRLALGVQNKTEILRDFLGLSSEVEFNLSEPDALPLYLVDKEDALAYAIKNRSASEGFRLQLLSAEREVEFAKKDNGPNLRFNGSFGLTNQDNTFSGAYQNLLDQEGVALTIDIPIADFGRAKAQQEIAKSNLELTQLQIQQSEVSFERDVLVNVEQFELKRSQLKLSEEALDIATRRLDIAKKRYQIGKIDVTNLNIAIQEELNAKQQYYATLWDLWRAHYTIRNLTLFDFENNIPIE